MSRRLILLVAVLSVAVAGYFAVSAWQTPPGCYSDADARAQGYRVCINNQSR